MAKRKQMPNSKYHQLSKSERAAYEDSLKYYRDLKNSFDTAEQDGFEKAEKLYETKLKEAQKREAEAQKREAEARQKIVDLAKMLKEMDVSAAQIAEKTGLTKEEIKKL